MFTEGVDPHPRKSYGMFSSGGRKESVMLTCHDNQDDDCAYFSGPLEDEATVWAFGTSQSQSDFD